MVEWKWDHPGHLAPKSLHWSIGLRLANQLLSSCGSNSTPGKIVLRQKYVNFLHLQLTKSPRHVKAATLILEIALTSTYWDSLSCPNCQDISADD